jgi:hypothetical protein
MNDERDCDYKNLDKIKERIKRYEMKNRKVSIDDFIVKKPIHMKTEIPPPQLKVINVNTSAHKIKGVAPKQHKDKI